MQNRIAFADNTPNDANGSSLPFIADKVRYDDKNGVINATGNVQLNYEKNILIADQVIYNERNNSAIAKGNVKIIEPSGEIFFADYLDLKEDLTKAFADNIKILLTDNARITALDGDRVDGEITRLNKATYSPCDLCEVDPTKSPLWQMKSRRVVHDKKEKEIYHHHAFIEMKGVPVLYAPSISHPDPTVKRRSGLLTPSFGGSTEFGTFLKNTYYLDIAPNKDLTTELTLFEKDIPLLGGEYRHRLNSGEFKVNSSITKSKRFRGFQSSKENLGNKYRGHIFTDGRFDINDLWRWGFIYNYASDDTYLKTYEFSDIHILNRKVFLERFNQRNYFRLAGQHFQDLRPDVFDEPRILPWLYNQFYTDKKYLGGTINVENEFYFINRAPGTDSSRLSAQATWLRRDIYNTGFITDIEALARGDFFFSDQSDTRKNPAIPVINKSTDRHVTVLRDFSQISYTASYPLSASRSFFGASYQQSFDPLIGISIAPNVRKNLKTPNEDGRDFEFDYNNLFVQNKFNGFDLLEGGKRLNYGFNTGIYGDNGGEASLFIGQSYRFREDSTFHKNSGLEDHFSDYVGRFVFNPSSLYNIDYTFRFDQKDLTPRIQNVHASVGPRIFSPQINYLLINQNTIEDKKDFRQEIIYGFTSNFRKGWTLHPKIRRRLGSHGDILNADINLTYEDECFKFITIANRDYTKRSGIDPGSSIYFQIIFKTIGAFETPHLTN